MFFVKNHCEKTVTTVMVNNTTRKTTTTSHFKSLNTKNIMTYADGNPCTGLDMSLYHGWIPVIGICYAINNLDFIQCKDCIKQ